MGQSGIHAGLRSLLVLLGIVLLAACPSTEAGAARASALPSTLRGVNITSVGPTPLAGADRAIANAQALHANVVRTEVPWSEFEPTSASQISPGSLAFMDRLASDASAAGIRLIATVDRTPCWASSAPSAELARCVHGRDSPANAWPPRRASDYAAFVAFLARRYGAQLAAIEIWNEPDQANQLYFAGPHKAVRYAALLRAAYPAIKRANPAVPVLAGSIVGSNGIFLRALYAAGIQGYYDGLAVHFYTLVLASLRAIHEVQLANGDAKPLWLDEFGWSSCWPHQQVQQEQGCVTTQIQAANLRDTMRSLAHTPYLATAVVYQLQDFRHEDFGLVTASGTHKPAFAAFTHAASSASGTIASVTVSLHPRGGALVASGSGPVGDFMQLEAFQGSVLRYRALFTLDRFNRYTVSLPSVLGVHDLQVRVFRYWDGVGSDAHASV